MPFLPRLCYITDRRSLASRPVLAAVAEAIRAAVDLVQIREKDLATRPLVELVEAAVQLSPRIPVGEVSVSGNGAATRLVVNDRLDVALACGAQGVHLGTQSIPPAAARRASPPEFLIGVSCHSLEEALEAERASADYILLGPIFETPSKRPYGPPLGLAKLEETAARVRVPVLALGGITVARAGDCLRAGASGIAGISVFQDCPSLEARAGELRAQFDADHAHRR